MFEEIWTQRETDFAIRLIVSLVIGYAIGAERESRRKAAGISTHTFVVAGAALFAYLSQTADPDSPARVAAQIVSGVGFLGAGIILKDGGIIRNLTTAASIWFAASIGMAVGYGWYTIALMAGAFSVVVPRIPHIGGHAPDEEPTAVPARRRRGKVFRSRR